MGRLTAGLRVLARRRAYLAAMAAAGLVLVGGLGALLVLAALWAWAMPADWGIANWGLLLALLLWLPYAGTVLAFLSMGIRAYTLATSGPPPSTPAGVAGGMAGLGVSAFGHRLARRRGPLAWLRDPWGTAAAEGLGSSVPEGHPLRPLLRMAEEQQRRPSARGVGWLAVAIVGAGMAAWWALDTRDPALASVLLAPVLLLPIPALILAAALRGVLRGAWDRYMMDAMAARAEHAAYAGRFEGYEPRP